MCVLTCVHSCTSTFRICISYIHVLIKIFISFHLNNTYKYHFYLVTCNQAAKKYFAISSSSSKVRKEICNPPWIWHQNLDFRFLVPASEPGLGSGSTVNNKHTQAHFTPMCAMSFLVLVSYSFLRVIFLQQASKLNSLTFQI